MVRLPAALASQVTHRHGGNGFVLHRMPQLHMGRVLGLLGSNGIGKSTALAALGGRLMPNLGVPPASGDGDGTSPPDELALLRYFRGSPLQNYFAALWRVRRGARSVDDERLAVVERAAAGGRPVPPPSPQGLRVSMKHQHVDAVAEAVPEGTRVRDVMVGAAVDDERVAKAVEAFQLRHLLDRPVAELSGGERQRLSLAHCLSRDADVYLIDEPSSFLDVRQRFRAAAAIRALVTAPPREAAGASDGAAAAGDDAAEKRRSPWPSVLVVDHDLCVLDYVSDKVSCLYGEAAAFGVVTPPAATARAINAYLRGYLPGENVRFRDHALVFHLAAEGDGAAPERDAAAAGGAGGAAATAAPARARGAADDDLAYAAMEVEKPGFSLRVAEGRLPRGRVTALCGENGTGKTTFVKALAASCGLKVAIKPQQLSLRRTKEGRTVLSLLSSALSGVWGSPVFTSLVSKPLGLHALAERPLRELSGGELQRVALCLCLGRAGTQLYLIDEPSAFLDVEQRLAVTKAIRGWVEHTNAACVLVEHDFLMATALAARVVVFSGTPGVACSASAPEEPLGAINRFLGAAGVTFRRDRRTGRPRMNEPGCRLDKEQKRAGRHWAVDAADDE